MTKTKSTFLALVAVLLSPMAANADLITTSVGTYDVTTIVGTFSDLMSTLMGQVWWEDETLATEFAGLTQGFLGISALNSPIFGRDLSALFAVCNNECLLNTEGGFPIQGSVYAFNLTSAVLGFAIDNRSAEYAITTRVPEPGTLALFGIGLAALGLSRRRKKI